MISPEKKTELRASIGPTQPVPIIRKPLKGLSLDSAVHDRTPVILSPDACDVRLDPGFAGAVAVSKMLKPLDARMMKSYPVSARVLL